MEGFTCLSCLGFGFSHTAGERRLRVYWKYLYDSDWFWDKSKLKQLVSISKGIYIVVYKKK